MPKTRFASPAQKEKWAKDQVQRRFDQKLRTYRAMYELTDREICGMIGMSQGTFIQRKKDPEQFTVAEIKRLCAILHWGSAIRAYIWYGASDPDQMAGNAERPVHRAAPVQGNVSAMYKSALTVGRRNREGMST